MSSDTSQRLVDAVAAASLGGPIAIVAAESVTSGSVAHHLAQGERASEWFVGSFVTYRTSMKRTVLGVTAPGVISAQCAREMAVGALDAAGADVAVSITGVGGPEPEEGRPPGTVFICTATATDVEVFEHSFDGEPWQIVTAATDAALAHLLDHVRRFAAAPTTP